MHYRHRADDAAHVCQEVSSLGRRAISTQCDVTDRPAVWQMVETVSRDRGPIDLLVNNAGDAGQEEFARVIPDRWDHTIAVNLTGAFNVIWAVKGSMMARTFGRIVNVSSVAAMAVRPNLLAYSAAKVGLNSLTKSCCEPLARYGLRINGVAPGTIETDMAAGLPPAYVDQLRSATPLGRLGQAEESPGSSASCSVRMPAISLGRLSWPAADVFCCRDEQRPPPRPRVNGAPGTSRPRTHN